MNKQGGMPYYTPFTPLFRNAFRRPPFFSDLLHWSCTPATDGVLVDKIGKWSPEYRVGGVYLATGTINIGLPSTSLTYLDATTGLEVSDTTDASGDFVVPANGLKYLTIDGHFFPCEESTGDYIGATDAEYYSLTSATWDISDGIPSYADENGYTIADGYYHYWDEALTLLIPSGVNITSGAGWEDETIEFETYVTDDDYIYVTDDGFAYLMEGE